VRLRFIIGSIGAEISPTSSPPGVLRLSEAPRWDESPTWRPRDGRAIVARIDS
jgi:hypothetical protein